MSRETSSRESSERRSAERLRNRERARAVGSETLGVLHAGMYTAPSGKAVYVMNAMERAVAGSRCFAEREAVPLPSHSIHSSNYSSPSNHSRSSSSHPSSPPQRCNRMELDGGEDRKLAEIQVVVESTIEAVKRLVEQGAKRVAVLNFANAVCPGGGFLNGSLAQEESICRASGLYPTLKKYEQEYYSFNRHPNSVSGWYSDTAIYSPDVPIFREDSFEARFLEVPYFCTVITLPAPMLKNLAQSVDVTSVYVRERLERIFVRRFRKCLEIARFDGADSVVLGAFGCGAFRNDPYLVGRAACTVLEDHPLREAFQTVSFSIKADNIRDPNVRAFQRELRSLMD